MSLKPLDPTSSQNNALLLSKSLRFLGYALVIISMCAEIYYLTVGRNTFNNQIAYCWQQFFQGCNTYKYEILAGLGGLIIVGIAAKVISRRQKQSRLQQKNPRNIGNGIKIYRKEGGIVVDSVIIVGSAPWQRKTIKSILNKINKYVSGKEVTLSAEEDQIMNFLIQKYPDNKWKQQCELLDASECLDELIVGFSQDLFKELKGFLALQGVSGFLDSSTEAVK